MIRTVGRSDMRECLNVIRESSRTVAEEFDFFPFTCGYMEKDL